MKINVSSILKNPDLKLKAEGEVHVSHISYKGEEISINAPIKVDATVENTGKNLLLTGIVKTELILKCSRCLEDFKYDLEAEFEEELSNKDNEDGSIKFEGDTIDLTDIVINNILLSLPMKAVCSENCKGLCPYCGKNKNHEECDCTDKEIDPRLTVLKDLLKGN